MKNEKQMKDVPTINNFFISIFCHLLSFRIWTFRNIVIAFKKFPFVLSCTIILMFLFVTFDLSHASMPEFQRLSPLTKQINSPASIASDSKGRIYVASSKNNKILIFNQQGQNIDSIKGLAYPISVAVDSTNRVYVGNEKRGNVEVYDANLNFLHKLAFSDGEFIQPNDIAIDNVTGNVYVADFKKSVVGIYDSTGNFVRNFGEPGNENGQFHFPASVAIDVHEREIIVLDRALKKVSMMSKMPGARVQFFNLDGTYLRSFNKFGFATGELVRPQRLEIDQERRLYITDSSLNAVLVYENDGDYLGAIFDADNPFRTPLGLTFDLHNKLYIASHHRKRIEVYGIDEFLSMSVAPIALSYSAREQDENPKSQEITIHNDGTTTYNWNAVASDDWIILSEDQGVLDKDQLSTINLVVDITGLNPGEYKGNVNISVGDGEMAVVEVTLTVEPAPVLSVSPLILEFTTEVGLSPLPQLVFVENIGNRCIGVYQRANPGSL